MSYDEHMSRLRHREIMARREAYCIASEPIIKAMGNLRLMFTTPWMIFKDGVCVESGERWTDEKANKLYDTYAETLVVLQGMYLSEQPKHITSWDENLNACRSNLTGH